MESLDRTTPHVPDVDPPARPLMQGQVLVRVEVGGVSAQGDARESATGIADAGQEIAGIVEALGPAVIGLNVGDRVAINPTRPCGHCALCRSGLPNQCREPRLGVRAAAPAGQGAEHDGHQAPRLLCDATQCFVAGYASASELALAAPFSTALHAAERAGGLRGKRVLIMGCGPIGALVVAVARLHGARDIVAADLVPARLAIVRGLGARVTLDLQATPDALTAWADMIDVAFECMGGGHALRAAMLALRPRGVLVQVDRRQVAGGRPDDGPEPAPDLDNMIAKELTMLGAHGFHEEFGTAVSLIDSGRAALGGLITHSFGQSEAACARSTAQDASRAVKVQIVF